MLEVRELTKRFGGLVAVNNVNLNVNRGEVRAIIGPNGAGKTTLFNLISGYLTPTKGKIYFQGKDITDLPVFERAKLGLARAFQIINIFPNLSVRKNIEIAVQARLKKTTGPLEIVNRASLKEVTDEIIKKYGLLQDLYIPAGKLNYADQRKLEILLSLVSDPLCILLDEPAAGLDENETHEIMGLIKDLSKSGKAILLIDHDMKFVMAISDKVTVMNEGKIIAEGTPKEIANSDEVIQIYLGESKFE